MKRDERVELVERERLSSDACLLHFRSVSLFGSFLPGQFTMLRLPSNSSLLLRRPYSFCDARGEERSFSLLVKNAGKGTAGLLDLPVGDSVDCLGPLGSSFTFPPVGTTPVIVAGGVGIAPFVFFCRGLHENDRRGIVLLGGQSASDLYLRSTFASFGMDVRCTTEDGSYGRTGRVTDLLPEILENGDAVRLYSCGPSAMLVNVARMAREKGVPHQVSLERRMGCGMGCCLGCVVYTREYVRCCTEGPVFDADEVDWERDHHPL